MSHVHTQHNPVNDTCATNYGTLARIVPTETPLSPEHLEPRSDLGVSGAPRHHLHELLYAQVAVAV